MTQIPIRPGNEHTWHGDRPDWIGKIERGVFYFSMVAGGATVAGLLVGITWAAVTT